MAKFTIKNIGRAPEEFDVPEIGQLFKTAPSAPGRLTSSVGFFTPEGELKSFDISKFREPGEGKHSTFIEQGLRKAGIFEGIGALPEFSQSNIDVYRSGGNFRLAEQDIGGLAGLLKAPPSISAPTARQQAFSGADILAQEGRGGFTTPSGAVIGTPDFSVAGTGRTDQPLQNFAGQTPQQIADQGFQTSGTDVFSNGVKIGTTTAPITAPQVAQPGGGAVKRELGKEQEFVKNWQGKEGRLPTSAEINQSVYGTPNPNFTTQQGITPEGLEGATPLDVGVPGGGVGVGAGAGTTGTATGKTIDAFIQQLQTAETAEGKQAGDLTSELSKLIGETEGQEAFLQEQLDKTGGANELRQQLTGINEQINTLVAEQQRLLTEQRGKPITMDNIIGSQAQINAVMDSRIFTLTARANSLMGNIEQARIDANNAVNAKFGPTIEAYNIALKQLELLKPTLDKQDTERALAQQAFLNQQLQLAGDAKAEAKSIQNIMIDAVNAGIKDENILTQIENSASVSEAIRIFGQNRPTTTDDKAFTLGPEQTRFDAQGNIIAVGGQQVQPTGQISSFNINEKALNLDSSTQSSLGIINSQASEFGGLKTGAIATSTFRTREQQQILYDAYLAGGPQAAPPGQSAHERGMAIDLFPDQGYIEQMRPIMNANGWVQTAGVYDLGHFEFQAGGEYSNNIEFKYNEKIDTNRLPDIGKKAITDKSARMSNLPFGITSEQANWIMKRRPGNIEFQRLKTKDYDSLAALLELREDIVQIRDLKTRVNTGPLTAPAQLIKSKFPGQADTADFSALLIKTGKNLADYIKSISGAAVSEEEAQRLSENIPHVRMQDKKFDVALDDFADDFQNLLDAKLTRYGIENEDSLRDAVLGNRDYNNALEGDDSLRAKYNY